MMIVVMDLMKLAVPPILQVWLCTELGKGVMCLVQVNEVLNVQAYQEVCAHVHTCTHTKPHAHADSHMHAHMLNVVPSHCHEALGYETCLSAIKNILI